MRAMEYATENSDMYLYHFLEKIKKKKQKKIRNVIFQTQAKTTKKAHKFQKLAHFFSEKANENVTLARRLVVVNPKQIRLKTYVYTLSTSKYYKRARFAAINDLYCERN